jgi:GMP synthase-like glutamine amidotransferase
MRIHYLQHVPFEDLANISRWAEERGHDVSHTLLFSNKGLPGMEEFDWLIVMGGPMNICEHDRYPWLVAEKRFIKQAIEKDKIVLGICLGAQLMADVMGGQVRRNEYREIGWHAVRLTPEGRYSRLFHVLPREFTAFHWHGDTFAVPPGAVHTAESDACRDQAFEMGKVVGLQFHLESSMDSIDHLIANCSDELDDGIYVQRQKELLSHLDRFSEINGLMDTFLDNMESELG